MGSDDGVGFNEFGNLCREELGCLISSVVGLAIGRCAFLDFDGRLGYLGELTRDEA